MGMCSDQFNSQWKKKTFQFSREIQEHLYSGKDIEDSFYVYIFSQSLQH